ncbi:hypothetical protein [Streptomyces sp. HUCO-GS316]|uniref:hypothetical protein n=1 Tax=Streptomyces sp. HUCO-GS316 TaxID=2692198 RepID=UPI00301BC4A2
MRSVGVLFAVGAVSGTILSFEMGLRWPAWASTCTPGTGWRRLGVLRGLRQRLVVPARAHPARGKGRRRGRLERPYSTRELAVINAHDPGRVQWRRS